MRLPHALHILGKKWVSLTLIVTLIMTQMIRVNPAYSEEPKEEFSLVAILVEADMWKAVKRYDGLSDEYSVSPGTIQTRIERYAEDLQESLPYTKTAIITVDANEDPKNISAVLERLYFEGEVSGNEVARLVGVQLVGDLPLPVVNKNGNRFLSMYPYTDFYEKAYIYNPESGDFEANGEARDVQPEVWHGVITAPVPYQVPCSVLSGDDTESEEMCLNDEAFSTVAEFFDKNHLYRQGVGGFDEFNNSMLVGHEVVEEKVINPLGFANYQRYIDHAEDIAYHRYTKELAEELFIEINGELEESVNTELNIDNDGDGSIDEDGRDDNNADGDDKTDEDGPGDMDGDGCPGECEKDDDRDCRDTDKDGLRDYFENQLEADNLFPGFDDYYKNKLVPFPPLIALMITNGIVPIHNRAFCEDEPPLQSDPNCYEPGHAGDPDYFHPEWDDDEDGYCDEDGLEDNDNDGDGQFDEDHGGEAEPETGYFDLLPDVQSKMVIDRYLQEYYSQFEKHLGNVNNWTNNTGRYSNRELGDDTLARNDTDTLISLISKKDSFVKNYLRAQNEYLEGKVDDVVENIQTDIPLIAGVFMMYRAYWDHDADPSTAPIVDPMQTIQFINHSIKQQDMPLTPYIWGVPAHHITSAEECSLHMGTLANSTVGQGDEDAKIVEINRVYDPLTSGRYNADTDDEDEEYPDNFKDGDDFGGCFGNNIEHPEWCFPLNAKGPVRWVKGARAVDEDIPVDYRACYDFKEASWFAGAPAMPNNYLFWAENMSDVTWKLMDKGHYHVTAPPHPPLAASGCCQPGRDVETPEEFDIAFEFFQDWMRSLDANETPYRDYDDMVLVDHNVSGGQDIYYTMTDAIEDLGYETEPNQLFSEGFLANGPTGTHDEYNVAPNLERMRYIIGRVYVDKNIPANLDPMITPLVNNAVTISSVVQHKEPTNSTIMQQVEAGLTLDLPIDSPRYTTFRGQNEEFQKFIYPNLFRYESVDDFRAQLAAKDTELSSLPGASSYNNVLVNTIDNELNRDMMEDAIEWVNMDIDEKHRYMLTTFLNPEEDPFIKRPSDGYEVMYFVGDGDAHGYNFSFNGAVPEVETDIEWLEAQGSATLAMQAAQENSMQDSAELMASVEDGPGSGHDATQMNVEALPLFEWLEAMVEWIDDLSEETSFAGVETYCGNLAELDPEAAEHAAQPDADFDCIPDIDDPEPLVNDADGDGIIDGAETTSRLELSVDRRTVKADGKEEIEFTIIGQELLPSGYERNLKDSHTQVELFLTDEEREVFLPVGVIEGPLSYGKTRFKLISTLQPGRIILTARAVNRSDIPRSNEVSVGSVKERINLVTYVHETEERTITYDEEILQHLVIKKSDGALVGRLDVETGALGILDLAFEKRFVGPSGANPGYVAVVRKGSTDPELSFEDEIARVYVTTETGFEFENLAPEFVVNDVEGVNEVFDAEGNKIALVDARGQLFLNEDYRVFFKNDVLSHMLIESPEGIVVFELVLDVDFTRIGVELVGLPGEPVAFGVIEEIEEPGFFARLFGSAIPVALASADAMLDADNDGLTNMEEFVIGTDIEGPDSDGDKFTDSQEVRSGFDPLAVGERLFSDVPDGHEALDSIIELYVRGILSGFGDGSFKPDNALTREQFVKINLGAACIDCTAFAPSVRDVISAEYNLDPFPDENITPELQYCVAKGKIDGIVSGYLGEPYAGFFVPQNSISRAEASKVLLETAKTLVDPSQFTATTYAGTDRPWFYEYVKEAQRHNLYPDGRFTEVDHLSSDRFVNWFDLEILNSGEFMQWLAEPITRAEFAMMVQNLFQVSDCREADMDGDGLPDNSELYQYGTDPNDPDTDLGGVTDGNEVVRAMDPLDNSDEGLFEEFDTVEEEALELDDDLDDDGLTNEEELAAGTDPENADSDGDGIFDGDELLLGTDPTVADSGAGDTDLVIEGFFIEREVVYRERQADETFVSDVIIPKDILPASELVENLVLEAQILDANGEIDFNDNSSIVEFIVEDDSFAEIERQLIQTVGGIASTTLRSKEVSGRYHVRAELVNKEIAPDDKSVLVHSLNPVEIEMGARSTVLQAGVISRVDVVVDLKDQYDNIANYDIYEVEIEAEGPVVVENPDENKVRERRQLIFTEGTRTVTLFSTEDPGEVTLRANLLDAEGEVLTSAEFEVESHKEIHLEMTHSNPDLRADTSSDTEVRITAVNENGTRLEGFNEIVHVSLSDESMGVIRTDAGIEMEEGFGTAVFRTGTLSGTVFVNAESPGVIPGLLPLKIAPLSPEFIQLTADSDTLYTRDGASVTLTAKLFDKYGNFVGDTNGSGEFLEFSITPDTSDFAALDSSSPVVTSRGEAQMLVLPRELSGPVNILVKHINDELTPATISLNAKKRVDFEDIKESSPNVLFASLLGTAAGDVTEPDNLASWMANSGKTQSVVSLLEDPESFVKRAEVRGNGMLSNVDTTYLYTEVLPANDPLYPTRFVVKDIVTDRSLVEVFVHADANRRMYLNLEDPALGQEGIFLNLLTEEPEKFNVARHKGMLNLTENGQTVVAISDTAQINVIDKSFDLTLDMKASYPRVVVSKTGNVVAEILINFSFEKDIRVLDENDFEFQFSQSLNPGVYLVPHLGLTNFELEKTFTGNSSKNHVSYSLADTSQKLPSDQSPGSTYLSLEHAQSKQGLGFEDDNKHILLFTSGMMAGEAMMDNMSEIGIILGDATISLEPSSIGVTGFDHTIGTKVMNGNELIKEITPYDYNDDGLDDLLVSYEDGEMKLLENKHALKRFENVGTLLNVQNGVISQDIGDFDKNGYDDIVIAAQESCRADEEICVDIYWNDEGRFTRENLGLALDHQVHMLRVGDINADSYPDIAVSDASGSIHTFYNDRGVIDPEGVFVGNLGVKIDTDGNFADELLIHYPGMPTDNLNHSADDHNFRTLSILDDRGYAGSANTSHFDELASLESKGAAVSDPQVTIDAEFIKLEYDDVFFASSKEALDLNGDILEPGDAIQYTLTIRNTGGSSISDIVVSDLVADSMTFDPQSVECLTCTGFDLEMSNSLTRPFIVRNFTVPANGEVKFTYEATINSIPKVNITLGENFTERVDNYLDIAASPEGNPSGIMTYFYSDFPLEGGRIQHEKQVFVPTPEDEAAGTYQRDDGIDMEALMNLSGADHDPSKADDVIEDVYETHMTGDLDGDGLPNEWDDVSGDISVLSFDASMPASVVEGVFDQAAAVVEDVISKMQCGGGCLALPLNISFLTPGNFNMFGIPVGFDNGTPIFCWGALNTSTVGAASVCSGSTGGRLYLSPTLNGGLVFSLCLGVDKTGQCWSFNIPLLQALGVCDAINGALDSVMSKAGSFVESLNGNTVLSMNGQSSGDDGGGNSGVVSYNLGSYSVPSTSNSNVRVPGFPSVFTDWIDRQTEEFGDLLDLPDIYFIYPDPQSMVGTFQPTPNQEVEISTLHDALNFMNSLPLFEIQSEEVIFRIPAVTQVEIEKLQQDAQRMTENLKSQLETFRNVGEGFGQAPPEVAQVWASAEGQRFMDNLEDTIKSIEKNILVLEEYAALPEKIMDYRFAVTYYVTQIVCYVDAILNFSGGYVIKNKNRIKAWVKAITDVIDAVKTWQDLLNLSISYQESCDKCTTARLTLMEMMMKVFVAIPSPPIVDLPKWPDIILDISNIQGGVTLYFPELKVVPEPIVLPDLPKIFIPQNIPAPELQRFIANYSFPEMGVLPEPPRLPDLPRLPALPLPKLPDIPPPPEFPELPEALSITANGLEKIIKIVCLVKNGFIPSNEATLKTKVEDLTARGSDLILPIDKGFTIETPDIKIDFVDRIEINTTVNLDIDVTPMRDAISNVADQANVITDQLSGVIEQGTEAANDLLDAGGDLTEDVSGAVDSGSEAVDGAIPSAPSGDSLDGPGLGGDEPLGHSTLLDEFHPEIVSRLGDMEAIISQLEEQTLAFNEAVAGFSDDFELKADFEWLGADHPLLNRDLDELRINAYDIESLDVPYLAELAGLKEDLIVYADRMHETNTRFGDNVQIENVQRMFAADGSAGFLDPITSVVSFAHQYDTSENVSFYGAADELEEVFTETQTLKDEWIYGRPLAINSVMSQGLATATGGQGAEILHKGIFIYNEASGTSEKVVNYVKESGRNSLITMNDFDRDGDEDLVYTLGSDVYFKENYVQQPDHEFYRIPPKVYDLEELIPEDTNVNMFRLVDLGNGTAQTKWLPNHDAIGYELELKHALNDFYRTETQTERILVMPEVPEELRAIPSTDQATLEVLEGDVTVESTLEAPGELAPGDLVQTENGEALVTFDVTSRVQILENTTFEVPDVTGRVPELSVEGRATILTGDNLFAREGTVLNTQADSNITLNFDTREKVLLQENTTFEVPGLEKGTTVLESIDGNVDIFTHPRQIVSSGDIVEAPKRHILHTIGNTKLVLSSEVKGQTLFYLDPNTMFVLPDTLAPDTTIEVTRGQIELIDISGELEMGSAYTGMLITPHSVVYTRNNAEAGVVQYVDDSESEQVSVTLDEDETLRVMPLKNPEKPGLTVKLPNGNYYTKVRALTPDGERSTVSPQVLFAPQECGDHRAAFASTGPERKRVPIFKALDIDGSFSQDLDGEIEEYYYDLDLSEDKDRDGDDTNDVEGFNDLNPAVDENGDGNPSNDKTDPKITVGPYQDLETRYLKLWVKDQGGNLSAQEIAVDIYVPDIVISPVSAENGIVQGYTEPRESEMPFRVIRNRDGMYDTLTASDGTDLFYTDEDGAYYIDDFALQEEIVVLDAEGNIIATIDEETGRIVVTDERYRLRAHAASETLPTRVNLENIETGDVIVSTFLIPEVNTDVTLDGSSVNYVGRTLRDLTGVHVKEMGGDLEFKRISATDVLYPGGVDVLDGNNRVALIASNGNIYTFDSGAALRVKESAAENEPYVLELHRGGETLADIYISIFDGDGVMFDYTIGDPSLMSAVSFAGPIVDTENPDRDHDGLPDDFELEHQLDPLTPSRDGDPDGDGLTTSQEVNLGSNPNNFDTDGDGLDDYQEVLQGTDPVRVNTSPFNDIQVEDPLYGTMYDFYTKGIIQGYMVDDRQVFRPEKHITRAEYTKIMLEILCIEPRPEAYESPAVFSDIPFNHEGSEGYEWYYPITKESFLRNFITGYLAETNARGRAPFKPNQTINFAETAKIIEEVLSRFVTEEGTTVLHSLDDVEPGTPWYIPYLQIAKDLTPYLNLSDEVREAFILTEEEAKTPGQALTRYKFIEIADRVLNVYSCYEIDNDGDGLYNYLEGRFGTNPDNADTDGDGINDLDEVLNGLDPNGLDNDPDLDGLTNELEAIYGTDPFDPDTDHGGVGDAAEVDRGSDPNNAADDFPTDASALEDLTDSGFTNADDTANDEEPGVHIVVPPCTVCPCPATIENSADLAEGDIIFTAITSVDNDEVFTTSDPVLFKGLTD